MSPSLGDSKLTSISEFLKEENESIISNNVTEFPEQTLNLFPETLELVPLISRSFKHKINAETTSLT